MSSAPVQKAMAYITRGSCLLVFGHVYHPDAGLQAPGGSLEPREDPAAAAVREAKEETGLSALEPVAYLGCRRLLFDDGPIGSIERHYVHLRRDEATPEHWIAWGHTPSDGSPGPIAFEHYWAPLTAVPRLCRGMGDLLGTFGCQQAAPPQQTQQAVEHTPPLGYDVHVCRPRPWR